MISDTKLEDKWTFTANGSDRISLSVERADGTLVPQLGLQDKDGKSIASAEHDDTYARATIAPMTLPSPGAYTVVVGRYKGHDGKTSGSYKLKVTLLGIGADYGGTSVVQGALHIGTDRKGSLSNNHWFDVWTLQLDTTAPIKIVVNRSAGTLVPTIVILDTNLNEVAHAEADDTFATATLETFTPQHAGQYIVRISRKDGISGATNGDYQLSINKP